MKVITIGRNNENNDVVVNDSKVSRNHLQMVMDDQGNFSVVDLNSTNGTFVNGQRITGEVPLKVTDELKIGDTVLPWQSYFNDSQNPGTDSPIPSRMSAPKRPVSSGQQMSAPASKPKRWRLYAIIGTVVLLLAGLGLVWMINHNKPGDNVGQEKVSSANDDTSIINENNALKEELKREKNMRAAAERQVDKERSSSEKYKEEAVQANKAKNAAEQETVQANKAKNAAEQKAAQANKEKNTAEQEAAQAIKDKDAANQTAKDKEDKLKEAEKDKTTTSITSEYNNKMRSVLDQWKDKDADKYCKYKGYKPKNETAKKMLSNRFSRLNSNAEKEKMIKEMDDWSKKNVKNYKSIQ